MKKSFIVHLDSLEILDELTDDQAGKLLKAFRDYHHEKDLKLDSILRIVFVPFKLQFQRDNDKYEGTVVRNSLNGSKGGRPKKPTKTKQKQENPVGYFGLSQNPLKAKKADSDSDSVSDSGNDSESDSGNEKGLMVLPAEVPNKKFLKPSLQDVSLYVQSKEPQANKELVHQFAEKFWNFYESNGWKVGKNPMKSWQSAIRTWNETLQKTINPFKESSAKESFPFSPQKKGSWDSRQSEYLRGIESIINDTELK
jgi:hypothetical protein